MLDSIAKPSPFLEDRWDDSHAATLRPEELLLYRSNLLGSDKRITNFGGGNTSSKLPMSDTLTGETVEVLWVKGSGGDIGSMKLDGFSTLYMDKLKSLIDRYEGPETEDRMVGYYPHCTFNLNPRATSIDTPLHGFIPWLHVDHVHPDAIIAIAASADSKAITQEVFGDEIGWLPWRRPGFELGLWLKRFAEDNPQAKGVILEAHGLFTWGRTQRECYRTTVDTINKAIAYFAKKSEGKLPFGSEKTKPLDAEKRRAFAAALMPRLRELCRRPPGRSVISTISRRCSNSSIPICSPCSRRLERHAQTISCARRSARSCSTSTRKRNRSTMLQRGSHPQSRPTARSTRRITIAASMTTRRRCAIPTRSCTSFRASG